MIYFERSSRERYREAKRGFEYEGYISRINILGQSGIKFPRYDNRYSNLCSDELKQVVETFFFLLFCPTNQEPLVRLAKARCVTPSRYVSYAIVSRM